jgi:hypothetical protein
MAGNRRLVRKLDRGYRPVWAIGKGVVQRSPALPFEWQRIEDLAVFLARGLAWHHWAVALDGSCFVEAHLLQGRALREYMPLLAAGNVRARVELTLPGGTFRYRGVQATDKAEITLWAFEIYGGIRSENSAGQAVNVAAMSGPATTRARAIAQADLQKAWRRGVRLHR